MNKKELSAMLTFYAISPIHAGSGDSISAIDLPIQRERHTNWPHVQASAVKGALRSHFRDFSGDDKKLINLIFGYDEENDGKDQAWAKDLPGAISVSDAKLFAFPVRSNVAPFVWITCPAILKRLERDLQFLGSQDNRTSAETEPKDNEAFGFTPFKAPDNKKVLLEDAVVEIKKEISSPVLSNIFCEPNRILLVADEMFKYLVENCTEIQTHIKINSEKGTAERTALWYQELLPSDSVLYSVVYFSSSAMPAEKTEVKKLQVEEVKHFTKEVIQGFVQMGGDQTLGRGICKVAWYEGGRE